MNDLGIENGVATTNRLAEHLTETCIELIYTMNISEDQIRAAFRIALESVNRAAKRLPKKERRASTASPTSATPGAYTRRKECRDFHKKHGELIRKCP